MIADAGFVVYDDQNILVIEQADNEIIIVEESDVEIVTVAEQGPTGVRGPPGANGYVMPSMIAGEPLAGHRAVRVGAEQKVFYASASDPLQVSAVLGVTTNAATVNDPVSVQTYGDIEEPSWSWIPNQPIYLADGGQLTQVSPQAGFVLVIGHAITATRMFVSKQSPIKLS